MNKSRETRDFLKTTFGSHLAHDLPPYAPDAQGSAFEAQGDHIRRLLAAEGQGALLPFLTAHRWQVPAVATAQADFAANALFVELYGPETTPDLADFRAGLFFMAPGFFYGAHVHKARETYVRLAGAREFTLGKDQDRVETGALVINEPMDVHAIQAGPLGVLLAWTWTGDVGWDSYAYV